MTEQLVGLWALNGAGVVGKIQYVKGSKYVGHSIDNMTWASRTPIILHPRMQALFNKGDPS